MYARAVDEAAERLRELRQDEWANLALGTLALALAVAATQVRPALAVPLFLGGIAVGAAGVRALWRRWALVDRLVGDADAYEIAEVLAYASREATMERRRGFAAMIRASLDHPEPSERLRSVADELDRLAAELEDGELVLDPASAVACMRLLSDVAHSPFLNETLAPQDLRARVRRIRSGFRPRRLAA
jgi:hypothetical protein